MYGIAYAVLGLLTAFSILVWSYYDCWDEDEPGRVMATIFGGLIWPITLAAIMFVLVIVRMGKVAKIIAERIRNNRR